MNTLRGNVRDAVAEWKRTNFEIHELYDFVASRVEPSVASEPASFKPILTEAIRREVSTKKAKGGYRQFETAAKVDGDGNVTRTWTQPSLMKEPEGRSLVNDCRKSGVYFIRKGNHYATRFQSMGYQIPLPFPEYATADSADDDKAEVDADK